MADAGVRAEADVRALSLFAAHRRLHPVIPVEVVKQVAGDILSAVGGGALEVDATVETCQWLF